MPSKPHRLSQVNELIKQRFAEILNQELELPANTLITVTQVKTANDLKSAKIGLSIYPIEKADEIFTHICRRLNYLKYQLHQQLILKFAPEIRVFLDKTSEDAFAVEAMLENLDYA
jgi:ribosome-binding factor A